MILRPYQIDAINAARQSFSKSKNNILLYLSVGAGKSIIAAAIADFCEKKGKTCLIIAPKKELVLQNAAKYFEISNNEAGICCSLLRKFETNEPVVIGTPGSLKNRITSHFDVVIFDESHIGDFEKNGSEVDKLVSALPNSFIIGMTGTPYRGKSQLWGKDKFFKHCVYSKTMSDLISDGFLSPFRYPNEELLNQLDFSSCKIERGRFKEKDIASALIEQQEKTKVIIKELINIVEIQSRAGCFVFASNIDHCNKIISLLPEDCSGLITSKTPQNERDEIMDRAKSGKIKYLVSRDCLFTGIDIPHFDTIAWLRPTESRVVFEQGNGRALRLSPGKESALILDYSGNVERHRGALLQGETPEVLRELPCPECGIINKNTAQKCECCGFLFLSKECDLCGTLNIMNARNCKDCGKEFSKDGNEQKESKKLNIFAYINDDILIGDIKHMSLNKHISRTNKEGVRVDYVVDSRIGQRVISDYHLFNDSKYAKKRWDRLCEVSNCKQAKGVYNVNECIAFGGFFNNPNKIKFTKNDNGFFEVLNVE